jgi:transglutaminase-like putative cysteine protease
MTIKVALEHRTSYTFDRPVRVFPHIVRLRPAPHSRTPIEAYSLRVEPADHFINWQQDAVGNFVCRLTFPNPMSQLTITVGLIADLKVINPFDFFIEDWAETWPSAGFSYPETLSDDLKPYLRPVDEHGTGSGPGELVQAWVRNFAMPEGTRTINALVELNRRVNTDLGYSVRMEHGVQTPDFTLRTGVGSCRDFAWLLVSILRQMGLAARFVSGYLVQLASDVKALDGPSGPAADFTDLHAWAEVYIPGAGWIGLDPTSGLFAGQGHIPLAATPHPATAAPITGVIGPCESVLEFSNTVTRIHEDPRVTLPYTDEAWATIQDVARGVDERLAAGDVRLTVGGEPTFVSVDNQVDEEWTTAADGPHKRQRASELAARLKAQWAPQGLIHRGQGRWYPGEPLPRWQIALYWRTDGQPLWPDDTLLADPWSTDSNGTPADDAAAYELLAAIADGLGLPLSQVRPAYEDPLSRLAAKALLPEGDPVEPDADLDPETGRDTAAGRADLLARLDESTTAPAAFVLPLHRRDDDLGWASANWRLRRGRIVLVDGDSPAGLRLPLDSISWKPPRTSFLTDPTTVGDELNPSDGETQLDDDETAPTTAMVAEVRDGLLYVFMPPTEALEHFVDLIARLHAAAAKIDCAVVIEGYEPPPDPRLKSTTITPDPGVIEVNIAPTASFADQSRQLQTLYEQARLARLSTESFEFDGSHGGTGGGNHITFGGITPKDSPLLRRPDLLVSLLTYWQRHPSLSYLFAGRFIGTTSQAPRVDEGRPEAIYELEIAFAEIARLASPSGDSGRPKPWVTDRALRHRVLHRQARQPGQPARQAWPVGAARLRDAAASADGDGAVAAGAFAGGMVLGRTAAGSADPARPKPAWAISVAALSDSRHRRRRRRPARTGHRLRDQLAGPIHRIPLPAHRNRGVRRRRDRAARRDRAMEHPRRAGHCHRHRPLRRLIGRAHPGPHHRRRPPPLRGDVQRLPGAVAGHRHPRHPRGRRAVSGLAAAQRAAPEHHR